MLCCIILRATPHVPPIAWHVSSFNEGIVCVDHLADEARRWREMPWFSDAGFSRLQVFLMQDSRTLGALLCNLPSRPKRIRCRASVRPLSVEGSRRWNSAEERRVQESVEMEVEAVRLSARHNIGSLSFRCVPTYAINALLHHSRQVVSQHAIICHVNYFWCRASHDSTMALYQRSVELRWMCSISC